MSTLRDRLTALVREFVDRVERVVRDETREGALALLTEALRQTGGAQAARRVARVDARTRPSARPVAPPAGKRRNAAAAARTAAEVRRAAVRASRGTTGRRTKVRMQRDLDALVAYVGDNPGVGMEQIAEAVGSTSKRLAVPMRQLLSLGALMKAGTNRGARYWVRDLSVLERAVAATEGEAGQGGAEDAADPSAQVDGAATPATVDGATASPSEPERN